MPIQRTWKTIVSSALAITLVTGSGAAILSEPVGIYAASLGGSTPFVDIKSGHWAEKHIAKLALQGIINGYENKAEGTFSFKPEQGIKQQEAVLMALRFAGLVDQADIQAMNAFPDSFTVGQFYKPYIELAFKEGLLDRQQ